MMETSKTAISIYARSTEIAPSGYYRIIQFTREMDEIEIRLRPLLSERQFKLYYQIKPKHPILRLFLYSITYSIILFRVTYYLLCDFIKKPDYLILSRVFIPRIMPFYFRLLLKSILSRAVFIWDFDDDILESKQISRSSFLFLSSKSNRIVVIHEHLRSLLQKQYWKKVIFLPTTDGDMRFFDVEEIELERKRLFEKEIHLVWVGTSGNLEHFDKIIPNLDEAARVLDEKYNKQLVLNVVCNLPLLTITNFLSINNIKWSRNVAIECMKKGHIGIMPLKNTIFAAGKGGFKLVQYMSIGLPLVGSEVGFNVHIVDSSCGFLIDDEKNLEMWKTHLVALGGSWQSWQNLSKGSLSKWKKDFSFYVNFETWRSLLSITKS